jgi:DNA-binding transcriptional LysR family regulator
MPDRHTLDRVDKHIDLRRLQTFVTVSEQGTVSKAALLLRITQPALSRQIRGLQDELGIKLFERVGRRLLLTGEGDQFLADCRSLLSHAASIRERAQSLRGGDTGVLKVAASPQMIENVFPSFLLRYAARYPRVQMRPIEAYAIDHTAMLERGDVHLAISGIQVDDQRFGSYLLPPLQVLAVWHSFARFWPHQGYRRAQTCKRAAAAGELEFCYTESIRRGVPSRASRARRFPRKRGYTDIDWPR